MNFQPCNWCGGPVPIRKNACPRCGTPNTRSNASERKIQDNHTRFTQDSEISRLMLILGSYIATGLGLYIVIHGETTGESHFLLIGIAFAVFGTCGLVSAEKTPDTARH